MRLFNSIVLVALCSGCFARGATTASSGSALLPVKSAWQPNGADYNLSSVASTIPIGGESSNSRYAVKQSSLMLAVQADKGWTRNTDCSGVRIGIVDSGVDKDHDDLAANLLNIGSGNVGRDFSGAGTSFDVRDRNSHGTHVMGILAADGTNGTGVAGICWKAAVVIAKVTDEKGGAALSDVIDGINYLLDQDAKIINASLGSYVPATTARENSEFEDLFSGVTNKAASKGVLIVAAAGNNGANTDINRTYPASLSSDNIISVASNFEGSFGEELLSSSNFGGGTVHLSAPGYFIHSTLPEYNYYNGGSLNFGDKTGTSMAAPMVSGTLALMWSHINKTSSISAIALKELLLHNVESYEGARGVPGNTLITGGFLDVGAAMEAADNY